MSEHAFGMATKFLPQLLEGLATGELSGSELFLGRRGMGTACVDFIECNALLLTPVEHDKYNGLYVKHERQVYKGKGFIRSKLTI